ncbi:MAG TPA: indolepyruvate oxidoreductase subunit beta [Clostridia bacterium]|nr:indolepyruvate oxidoreductase subunit beta [Clostridia bacterium]
MSTKSIMIVGVGGQGTLLASRIIGNALIGQGYDVKMSEVHGMAQRGGSVVTYVKFGEKVFSPIVEEAGADIILAFEELEAARWVSYLKKDGILIMNTQKINPMPVITGAAQYPSELTAKLNGVVSNCIAIDALTLAREAGTVKSVNVVLIGIMAKAAGYNKDIWIEALEKTVPARFMEVNKKAFELGYAAG